MSRESASTIYATEGMTEGLFLASIEIDSTGCGITNLFSVHLCVALADFAVSCERVCLLVAVAQQKISDQASVFFQSREQIFPRPID